VIPGLRRRPQRGAAALFVTRGRYFAVVSVRVAILVLVDPGHLSGQMGKGNLISTCCGVVALFRYR